MVTVSFSANQTKASVTRDQSQARIMKRQLKSADVRECEWFHNG